MRNHHSRHRYHQALFEILESRQLLSATLQLSSLPLDSSSTQIQPVTQLLPTYQIDSSSLTPLQTPGPQGYTPAQIRAAYGLNQISFGSVTGDGSGQTIAIIDAYNDPTIKNDLLAFDAAFSLPNPNFSVISQTGSTTSLPPVDPAGAGNDNFEGEEALDVEWAHALAPGANILLVEARDASPTNLFAAVNFARNLSGVSVISMSFGGNETSTETQFDADFTTPSGHNGVTFVASTGDSGKPGGYPAYSPNVVATGGTSLSLDSLGNYQSETAWTDSGGGISTVEPKPSYQNSIVTQSSSFRTIPDVAFDANPNTGVSVYDSYNNGTTDPWEILGGTSVAAPSWSGIIAVADQGRALAGENTLDSRTNTLPLLYSAPAADFHDITSGNNGFPAATGYDLVTGRGSPKANLLIPFLVTGATVTPPPPTGPSILSITASQTTVAEGTALILTANGVSDPGATGVAVTFYEETNGIAGLQTGPNGDFAFNAITDGSNIITLDTSNVTGTFTLYAQVTDDSGGATPTGTSAPSITVTVVPPGSVGPSIASLSATPNPLVSGDLLTLTANNVTDPSTSIRRITFFEETNGIPGLQTGPDGDFSFRPINPASGTSIQLQTTGVTGNLTFYALALDSLNNNSADGTSAPSVAVDIIQNTPPDQPTNLTASAVSTNEIDLSFSETSSGQTGFTLQRALNPTFTDFTQLFTINRADILTYTDTDLAPDTQYFYRVEAFNLAGDSNFSNTADAITPSLGTHLAITQQPPASLTAGTPQTFVITLLNAQNQIATADNSSVTLAIASGPNNTTLSGTTTVQAVNGIATFTNLSLTLTGKYTLIATDQNLTAAKSRAFTLSPDALSAHIVLAQQPANLLPDQNFNRPLIVELQDQFGNLITSHSGQAKISLSSAPDNAVVKGSLTASFSKGIAKFRNLNLSQAGTYTLQLTDPTFPNAPPLDVTQIILPATTTITTPALVTAAAGKTLSFSAHLHSNAPSRVPFTGSLTLTDQNNTTLAVIPLTPKGLARFLLTNLAPGTYTVTLSYPGDPNHTPATSTPFTLKITPPKN